VSGDAVSSMPDAAEARLEIAADGTVRVNTGCNQGSGSVTVGDGTLIFEPLATTQRACADDSAQQVEAAVLAVLDGETTYSITERSLTITKGQQGLMFRAE